MTETYIFYLILAVGTPVTIWLGVKGRTLGSGILGLTLFALDYYLATETDAILKRSSVSHYRQTGKSHAGTIFPLLEAYQEMSPQSADILLFTYGDLTNLMKDRTPEELQDKILRETLRFFSGDILSADLKCIFPYIRAHIKFLRELYKINPVLVNQLHFPQYIGAFRANEIGPLAARNELLENMKIVIREKTASPEPLHLFDTSANTWFSYRETFYRNHPAHAAALKRISVTAGPEEHKKLADAIIAYLNGMLSLRAYEARGAFSHLLRDF